MKNKFFKSGKIFDNVTMIDTGNVQTYLVEGAERALLIDSGAGVGSIKAFVEALTDLPVSVVLTHGHVDHAPGALEYGCCYVHPDDIPVMYTFMHFDKGERLAYINFLHGKCEEFPEAAALEDVIDGDAVRTFPVYDGDVFDLGGGVKIEVIGLPGHSSGSIVLLDEKNRAAYTGDGCNINTFMNMPGSTTIEEYRESLEHLRTFEDRFDVMWGGHGGAAAPKKTIDDGIAVCEKVLAREDDAIPADSVPGFHGFQALKCGPDYRPVCGSLFNMIYSAEQLYKRPHPEIKGEPNLYR